MAYNRNLEGAQRVFTVGGKPQPTALQLHIDGQRSIAAARAEKLRKRDAISKAAAEARKFKRGDYADA